jgi:hypothetical protein
MLKRPFMAFIEYGFIMDQYGPKSELRNKFWGKPLMSNSDNMCETV